LKQIVEQYVKNSGFHVNVSDFFREALREKIQRDAPELYKALIKHD
jgi:Arc/MetJ-type ribon-helix-helix transcriptional regulator